MDPLTHGLLGGTAARLCARGSRGRAAALIGFIGAMAPDIDVIIKSDIDPLLALEYHRHFTHSIFFAPIGGLLVAGFFWLAGMRRHLSFKYCYLYALAGYTTHGFLDSATTYGTQLFWPLLNWRVSWDFIAIIDPVVTLSLLIGLLLSLRRSWKPAATGLAITCAYFAFGLYQHHSIAQMMVERAEARGQKVERIMVSPTLINLVLWRTVYEADGRFYVNAVRRMPLGDAVITEGSDVAKFDRKTVFPSLADESTQARDIDRFVFFTNDYSYLVEGENNVIGDLRYSMLPERVDPMWGIRVSPNIPNMHVVRERFPRTEDGIRQLWRRILGDSASEAAAPSSLN